MHYIRQKESNIDPPPHYVRYFDIDSFFALNVNEDQFYISRKGNKISGDTLYTVEIMVNCKTFTFMALHMFT